MALQIQFDKLLLLRRILVLWETGLLLGGGSDGALDGNFNFSQVTLNPLKGTDYSIEDDPSFKELHSLALSRLGVDPDDERSIGNLQVLPPPRQLSRGQSLYKTLLLEVVHRKILELTSTMISKTSKTNKSVPASHSTSTFLQLEQPSFEELWAALIEAVRSLFSWEAIEPASLETVPTTFKKASLADRAGLAEKQASRGDALWKLVLLLIRNSLPLPTPSERELILGAPPLALLEAINQVKTGQTSLWIALRPVLPASKLNQVKLSDLAVALSSIKDLSSVGISNFKAFLSILFLQGLPLLGQNDRFISKGLFEEARGVHRFYSSALAQVAAPSFSIRDLTLAEAQPLEVAPGQLELLARPTSSNQQPPSMSPSLRPALPSNRSNTKPEAPPTLVTPSSIPSHCLVLTQDKEAKVKLVPDVHVVSLFPYTRVQLGNIGELVVLESYSLFDVTYPLPECLSKGYRALNIPYSLRQGAEAIDKINVTRHPLNSVSSKRVIPSIKLLFLTGKLAGQKFLLDSSTLGASSDKKSDLDTDAFGEGQKRFLISSNRKSDIVLPGLPSDDLIMIIYSQKTGWYLKHSLLSATSTSSFRAFWYIAPRGIKDYGHRPQAQWAEPELAIIDREANEQSSVFLPKIDLNNTNDTNKPDHKQWSCAYCEPGVEVHLGDESRWQID